jgi:hypothetical protein
MADSTKPLVFVSYAHADEPQHPREHEVPWLTWMKTHFGPLEQLGALEFFSDTDVLAGQDWEVRIGEALRNCDIFILLVSPNSLKSKYIRETEVQTILNRQQASGSNESPLFLPIVIVALDDETLDLYDWLKTPNRRPRDGKALSDLQMTAGLDVRSRVMAGIVGEVVRLLRKPSAPLSATAPSSSAPVSAAVSTKSKPAAPLIDLSALPDTSLVLLRGRDNELALLDAAWDDPSTHVFSVVAWGGQGKTALVSTWVDRLKAEGGRGAEALLAWSFYSQGSKERAATADRFLDWALKKLGLPDPGPSATLKAERIAEALQARRVLLILDGLEPLQHGPGPQQGQLKDPTMRVLLRRVADAGSKGGLVLVTTRLAIKDIERWEGKETQKLDLSKLSDQAGAELLRDRKVKGPEKELREAVNDFGGHALALTLLSGFLVKRHGGDIYRRDCIGPMVAAERELNPIHAHARRVMKSMDEEWLCDAPLHAAIMRVIGLFDRPASADCLQALRKKPALPGLEAWQAADTDARSDAISELREAGLLLREDERAPDSLDAHPLAREWFGDKFRRENEAGFKAAHSRLYDHLRRTTREGDPPRDVAALEPLFQAIAHGCKAGRQQETLDDIYVKRICRRRQDGQIAFHAEKSLGAIGPCLAALAWFFDRPFEIPNAGLKPEDRSTALANAASFLGYLGRLSDARKVQGGVLEIFGAAEEWGNAAISASNLAETELALGDIAAAIDNSARGVDFADKCSEEFQLIVGRAYHAHARAVAGEIGRARALFADAEARQRKLEPQVRFLYSARGAHFCELLLGEGRFGEVAERGAYTLASALGHRELPSIGLDRSNLGRAELGLALTAPTRADAALHRATARQHLDTAVVDLQRSNMAIYIPLGRLARARLRRAEGDFVGAQRDLAEVLEIAEPGPMRLYLCDRHLELCRLALAERDGFAPLAATPPPAATGEARDKLTQTAREELDEAAKLIKDCGYKKRDAERDELNQVLDGKRLFRDLPIHA